MACLLLAALALFSLNAGGDYATTGVGKLFMEALGPVQKLVSVAGGTVDRVWRRYFALVGTQSQNEKLKAELARLKQELSDMEELKLSNVRLSGLLGLKQKMKSPVVAAQVVAADPTALFRTVIIDKGSKHGINPPMPVVHSQGVVGRVVAVSPNYSKVLLLSDPNAGLDVVVQRTRTRGVVQGAGPGLLKLKYILPTAGVTEGDRLIASGMAGLFPKGLLVGTVKSVKQETRGVFQEVEVVPVVDFDRLEEVLVVLEKPVSIAPEEKAPSKKRGGK